MSTSDPNEIRANIERTRDELSRDVDTLGDKVNPSHAARRQADRWRSRVTRMKDRVMGTAQHTMGSAEGTARGAYVLADASNGQPEVILLGTGSEVQIAVAARERLEADGVPTRVVSVPCVEWFADQDQAYKDEVLPPTVRARVSVEAGVPMGWREFVGDAGRIVGLTHYGASAAYSVIYEQFGLTDEAVVAAARESIEAARSGDAVPAGPVAETGGLPHPTGDR
jgi:transketolase